MPLHTLECSQVLHTTLEAAWKFFSDPRNLERITPAPMHLRPLDPLPADIHPGLRIRCRIRPLFRIPTTWVTEITEVVPPRLFVDEQRAGPYRSWKHEHHFHPLDEQTVGMIDRVTYQLPFGWLGNLVHPLLVRPQLRRIFDYRKKKVAELFGEKPPTSQP